MWFLETFICRKDNGVLMHVTVLHKKQLSETEKDIDIYICGNIRDLVSFHPLPHVLIPPFLFSFSVNVAAEALKRDSLYRCSLFLR